MPYTKQQLETALAEIRQRWEDGQRLAKLAADKLGQIIGLPGPVPLSDGGNRLWGIGAVTADPPARLSYSFSQYDSPNGCYNALAAAGLKMNPLGTTWDAQLVAEFDLSQDPAFANSPQKVYPVYFEYYDAHFAGW